MLRFSDLFPASAGLGEGGTDVQTGRVRALCHSAKFKAELPEFGSEGAVDRVGAVAFDVYDYLSGSVLENAAYGSREPRLGSPTQGPRISRCAARTSVSEIESAVLDASLGQFSTVRPSLARSPRRTVASPKVSHVISEAPRVFMIRIASLYRSGVTIRRIPQTEPGTAQLHLLLERKQAMFESRLLSIAIRWRPIPVTVQSPRDL